MNQKIFILICCGLLPLLAQAQLRVGLGTKSPRGTMDIKGNVFVKNALFADKLAEATEDISLLGITPGGEIIKVATRNTAASISLITYNLNNVQKVKVTDFDTKIDTANYIVAVVGIVYDRSVSLPVVNGSRVVPPIVARPFISNLTWHLTLDYTGGTSQDGQNGNWKVQLLVINKNIAGNYPLQDVPFKNGSTGTATVPPDL